MAGDLTHRPTQLHSPHSDAHDATPHHRPTLHPAAARLLLAALTALAAACAHPAAVSTQPNHPREATHHDDALTHPAFDPRDAGIPLALDQEIKLRQELTDALIAERAWEDALPHIAWLRLQLPGHWPVQLDFAQAVYFVNGDANAALDALERAIALKPVNPRALLLMGQILEDTGDAPRAILAYQQVLLWRDDTTQAALNLARLLRNDRPDEARALWESVLLREPQHLLAMTELAGIAERQRRLQDAEALYRRLLAAHPDPFTGHSLLIRFFQRTQQPDKAKAAQRELERSQGRRPKRASR